MKVDDTITGIFNTIAKEVKEKYGIEYSIDQIHDIVNTQIEATKYGFAKGISICWSRFCKFIFTNKVNRKIEVRNVLTTIDNEGILTAEERALALKDAIMESQRKKVAYIKESNPNTSRPLGISANKVLSTPNSRNNVKLKFKIISK